MKAPPIFFLSSQLYPHHNPWDGTGISLHAFTWSAQKVSLTLLQYFKNDSCKINMGNRYFLFLLWLYVGFLIAYKKNGKSDICHIRGYTISDKMYFRYIKLIIEMITWLSLPPFFLIFFPSRDKKRTGVVHFLIPQNHLTHNVAPKRQLIEHNYIK